MKTGKRILSILLSLMLALGVCAVGGISASAELSDEAYLHIGDITVKENGEIKVARGDGWSFEENETGGILSLDGFEMVYDGVCIKSGHLDLTITGSGDLTSTSTVLPAVSVAQGNLIYDGELKIRANCQPSTALQVFGNLTVEGGYLNAENTADAAVSVGGTMTVNGGSVNAECRSGCAVSVNRMTVNGGSVYAKTESDSVRAIFAAGITLNNGEEFMVGDENSSEVRIEQVVEISNYTELKAFASRVNGGEPYLRAKLVNDIDASASDPSSPDYTAENAWTPIGISYESHYNAIFDGCGYVITGLCFDNSSKKDAGLFETVYENGIVKNVFLKGGNKNVPNGGAVGGVVGNNYGTIINCGNEGPVSGRVYVGGVVGINRGGTVTNCYNTGSVSSKSYIGGVVGFNLSGGEITNCYNTGSLWSKNEKAIGGGILGYNLNGEVNLCYNTGNIEFEYCSNYESCAGGVVGYNDDSGSVKNCYNTGCIELRSQNYIGGVAGYAKNDRFKGCYYDSDRVSRHYADRIAAIGNRADSISTVAGLTTSQMTGTGALEKMIFDEIIEWENPWLLKENDDSYSYYPHLMGFNKDSQGNQLAAENIDTESWPARVLNDGADDVYETTVKAVDCESEITTGYKESKCFAFEIENMPEGAAAHIYYNGDDKGEGTSFEVKEPTEDYTVECKVLDADGYEIAASGEIKVKVKNGFFDRLKAFFAELIEKILGKAIIDFLSSVC